MTPADFLPTLAEVAITIAGFTGLIVSVRRNRSKRLTEQELFRVIATIGMCLIVVLSAILPYALSGLPVEEHYRWAAPLVLSASTTLILLMVMIRKLLAGGFVLIAPWITMPLIICVGILGLASLGSGLGLFLPYSSGLLVLHLGFALFASAVTLVATLAIVIRSENESD